MDTRQHTEVDAQGLGRIDQRKPLGKGLTVGHPLTAGELDEEPESMRWSPPAAD